MVRAAEVLVAERVVLRLDELVIEDIVLGQCVVRRRAQLVAARAHGRVVEAEVGRVVVARDVLQELLVVVFLCSYAPPHGAT